MTNPAPAPAPGPAPSEAGKTLGIVGLVLAIIAPLIGLIVSIIARNQSKAAGVQNTPAKIGIIVSIVLMALYILIWIIVIATGALTMSAYTY